MGRTDSQRLVQYIRVKSSIEARAGKQASPTLVLILAAVNAAKWRSALDHSNKDLENFDPAQNYESTDITTTSSMSIPPREQGKAGTS